MIIDRVKEIADNEGLSMLSLEKEIGAGQGSLSKAYKLKRDISAKWIAMILDKYPNYSGDWILTGRGGMFLSAGSNTRQPAPSNSDLTIKLVEKLAEQAEQIGAVTAEKRTLEAEKRALETELQLLREQTTMGLLSADGAFSSTAQIG